MYSTVIFDGAVLTRLVVGLGCWAKLSATELVVSRRHFRPKCFQIKGSGKTSRPLRVFVSDKIAPMVVL